MLPRLGLILLALLLLPASASAAPRVQHLHFEYGPMTIQPGQNTISIDGDKIPRPRSPASSRLPPQPGYARAARSRAST